MSNGHRRDPKALLEVLARDAYDTVCASSDGHLTLGWRECLWDAFGHNFPQDGTFRRGVWAYLTAKETLNSWERLSEVPNEYKRLPHQALELGRQLILGATTRKESLVIISTLERMMCDFDGEYWTADFLKTTNGVLPTESHHSCVALLFRLTSLPSSEESYYIALDADVDGDLQGAGPEFFACWDAIGSWRGTPEAKDIEHGYWSHWLFDLMPQVIGSIEDVRLRFDLW